MGLGQVLDGLADALMQSDVGVVCVEGAADLVSAATLDRRALARRDQPLVLIDLSVPRAVAQDVHPLDGVLSYDLDALQPIVDEHKSGRAAAMDEVGSILVAETHKFLSSRTYASFTPAIEELKCRFDEDREKVIDRVTKGHASARELELAHALEKHLLGLALAQLKKSARYARSEAALERVYRTFVDALDGRDA